MRKSKLKQTLSMLLTVLMVFMSMNFSVFAEELTTTQTEQEITTDNLTDTTADNPSAVNSQDTEEVQVPGLRSSKAVANTVITDEQSLRNAIAAADPGAVIEIDGYIELSNSLVIDKAITLRGSDMFGTIIAKNADTWAADGDKSSASLIVVKGVENGAVNLENMTVSGARDISLENNGTAYGHGINVYRSNSVTLNNIFSTDNSGAGLIVNGSTVDAQYLMTADNGWYSVNVEKSDTYAGNFTMSSDSVLGDAIQIQSDKGDVTVNASGYENYTYVSADNRTAQRWSNTPISDTAYTVSNNVKTLYTSITAAIQAVEKGGTVYLAPGTYDEAVKPFPNSSHNQEKSVNIVGAADASALVKGESVLTKGMYIGYDDSKTRDNTISIKGITFKNTGLTVADEKTVTIENNKFYNVEDNAIAVLDQLGDTYGTTTPGGSVIVKNNIIDGAGSAGINLRNPYDAEVTGNSIANVNHNGILFQLAKVSGGANYNAHSGKVIVTNNTVTNWDANNDKEGGRAIRIDTQGIDGPSPDSKVFTITENKCTKEDYSENTEDQDIVKITGVGNNTVNLTNNYWNSDSPAFDTILNVYIDAGSNKASSTQIQVYPFKKASGENGNAPISVKNGETTTQYSSLAEAVSNAQDNGTVTINDNIIVDAAAGGAIQVDKPMTITAAAEVTISTNTETAAALFKINAASVKLTDLNIQFTGAEDNSARNLTAFEVAGENVTIENCTVTGHYQTGFNEVTRGVVPNADNQGLNVINCTFTNIRQPGYFEGTGTLSGNTVKGTKGFVITANSNYVMSGNTFGTFGTEEGNAVDIAIIENSQTSTHYDAGQLSADNNGAVVENQLDRTLAKDGTFVIDRTLAVAVAGDNAQAYSLQKAVDGVKDENSTVKVAEDTYTLDSKLNITKPLTLEGVGAVIITKGEAAWVSTGDGSDAMLVSIENTKNVTLKNLTVKGAENIMVDSTKKASGSGINIYNSDNITLDKVISTNNAAAGVIVNSSSVTATDLQTSGNAWGGVNVDKKTDNSAKFTLSGDSNLTEAAPIYSENAEDVTVAATTAADAPYVATKMGNITVWSVTSDLTNKVYTLDDNQIATIYGSIEDAVTTLTNGGTIYLGESTDNNSFSIGYDVTLPDNITIQGTGAKASVVSLDYNGSNGSGSIEKSGTIITGVATKLKNITFEVTKPNRTGSSAAFSVYKPGFAMENCTVNVAGSVNDNYYIFDTNTLPADATVTITDSTFTSEAKAWTVYSGDISKQKTLAGKLTFTGNTITGNFSAVLSQITGAYDISDNTASLTADDACLADLMAVGSTWTNIQYESVISGNTLTTKNINGTDALIRILPIRMNSKVQALPAIMQEGFMPTVSENTHTADSAELPVYNVNMKRVHNNLATLRLQGALGEGTVIYTTYDNTATAGHPYVKTDAPIIGKTSGGTTKLYDNLQTAINEVGNGGTVTIPYTENGYTYNGDLSIRDGITIEVANSAGAQGTAKINGQVTIDGAKDVVMDGVSVRKDITGSGAVVTKNGSSLTYKNAAIENLSNKDNTNYSYEAGIRLEGKGDKVTIDNAKITATAYGIGLRHIEQELIVQNNSEITGWAAIMTSAGTLYNELNGGKEIAVDTNTHITVKDSKLTGIAKDNNYQVEGYAIVALQENYEKVSFEASNTTFTTDKRAAADGTTENGIDIRPYPSAVTLTNCTFNMCADATVINCIDNQVKGYQEQVKPYENNAYRNTITLTDVAANTVDNGAAPKIIARELMGGEDVDTFVFNNTSTEANILTEQDITWTVLDPSGTDITIEIATAEELQRVAEIVNIGGDTGKVLADGNATIKLKNDIDLSSIGNWTPIGTKDHPFTGKFDGQGYELSKLSVTGQDGQNYLGLFGAIGAGAEISRVILDQPHVTAISAAVTDSPDPNPLGKNVGALVGGTVAGAGKDINISGITVNAGQVTGYGRVAGILGQVIQGTAKVSISGCRVNGTTIESVNNDIATGGNGDKAGGIVGQAMWSTQASITSCFVENSTVKGARDIGGIIGIANNVSISNCNADVTIEKVTAQNRKDKNLNFGGIIGSYEGTATVLGENNTSKVGFKGDLEYAPGCNNIVFQGIYYGGPYKTDNKLTSTNYDNQTEATIYGEKDPTENGKILAAVKDLVGEKGIVNLAANEYTLADSLTIDKELMINGLTDDTVLVNASVNEEEQPEAVEAIGQETGVVINGKIEVQANSTLKGLTIKDNGAVATALVSTDTPAIAIKLDNCYLYQNGEGTNGNDTTNEFNKRSNGIWLKSSAQGTALNVTNSYIKLDGEKGHLGIVANADNVVVNMSNSKILSDNFYDRGILYAAEGILSAIENTEIDTKYYALNFYGNASNAGELTVDRSKLTGYAAMNIKGDNKTINVMNSTLIGRTSFEEGTGYNSYGTIVFDRSAQNNHVIVDGVDSVLSTEYVNGAKSLQYLVDMRSDSTSSFTMNAGKMEIPADTTTGTACRQEQDTGRGALVIGSNVQTVYNAGTNDSPDWKACIKVVDENGTIKNAANSVANALYKKEYMDPNGGKDYKPYAELNVKPESGDTLVIPDGAVITENIDMSTIGQPYELDTKDISINGINIKTDGDVVFTGSFAGSTKGKLVVPVGETETFDGDVKHYVTVQLDGSGVNDGENQSIIKAKNNLSDQNSFVKGSNATFEYKAATTESDYNIWTATHRTDTFDVGDGSLEAPYQIATPEQLKLLCDKVNMADSIHADKHYVLVADLTLPEEMIIADKNGKNGIGVNYKNSDDSWSNGFTGTFNGNKHTITMSSNQTNALFEQIGQNSFIKDLEFVSPRPLVRYNNGLVKQISYVNQSSDLTALGSGLIEINKGTAQNCYTNGTLSAYAIGNGTYENCYTIHNGIVPNDGSFPGTLTNTYYQGTTTDYTNHVVSAADMQKARFAMILDGSNPGSEEPAESPNWTYVPNAEGNTYPQLQWEAPTSIITPLTNVTAVSGNEAQGTVTMTKPEDGHIYAGDTVTVTAAPTKDYTFDSWYINEKTFEDNNRITKAIKVANDNTIIKATFSAKPKVQLSVNLNGTGGKVYKFNGTKYELFAAPSIAGLTSVNIGDTVKLRASVNATAVNTQFKYWYDTTSNRIVSENLDYEFTAGSSAINLAAVFYTPDPELASVTFRDAYNTVIYNKAYLTEASSTITDFPAAQVLSGYDFKGWYYDQNGTPVLVTKDTVVKCDMDIYPVFEKQQSNYTVTLHDAKFKGTDETTREVVYKDQVTAIAEETKANQIFAGWKFGNETEATSDYVGYNLEYNFTVTQDTHLYAVYQNEKPVIDEPTVSLSTVLVSPGNGILGFTATNNLVDTTRFKFVEAGFIYKKEFIISPDESQFVIDGENVTTRKLQSISESGTTSIMLGGISQNSGATIRAYLTYEDIANGQIKTTYSSITVQQQK
ncbi:right-handed parallel beta-helix repeat-containing protein [Eubacterium sp. 1001713B170207_170306_E7]|uniref:beta strand repeat-containing protein n=1 Tax=Eubacterium sp. 1001713B170207_170306_E7 TaxID=2787097 RepID=UPI0018986EC4|nr:right-handed parallel beta-helix repeat-containing protein [Eubacterium sp. 1001713B170207_170306_E7]